MFKILRFSVAHKQVVVGGWHFCGLNTVLFQTDYYILLKIILTYLLKVFFFICLCRLILANCEKNCLWKNFSWGSDCFVVFKSTYDGVFLGLCSSQIVTWTDKFEHVFVYQDPRIWMKLWKKLYLFHVIPINNFIEILVPLFLLGFTFSG